MSNCTRYLGLDVHPETTSAAIAEGRGKIRSLGKFPNRPEPMRKLIEKGRRQKDTQKSNFLVAGSFHINALPLSCQRPSAADRQLQRVRQRR